MPRVGFESSIPAFEREKTIDALDRAATVIGLRVDRKVENILNLIRNAVALLPGS
jgi:hypothetical protein